MRVLVIGGTGNVGVALLRRLSADPTVERLVVASRRPPRALPGDPEWRRADLGSMLPPDLLEDVDTVVHLGWLMQPTRAPSTTWSVNVGGTVRLLRALEGSSVTTLAVASSVGAYSPAHGAAQVDESYPTHGVPTSAYSREKAYVERLLDVFDRDQTGVRTVRVRPAFTFQAAASVQQRRLFAGPLVPGRAVARHGVPLVPDPGGIRMQLVHADDVAQAYHLAIADDQARGAYNITAPGTVQMPDVAAMLGGRSVRVPRPIARRALHAAWAAHLTPVSPGLLDLLLSVPMMTAQRARSDLGWAPRWTGREAVQDFLAGLRSSEGAPTPPLDPATSGPLRAHELGTSVRDRP